MELVNGNSSPAPQKPEFEIEETDYLVFASFVEIYNEKIYDLLVNTPADSDVKRTELRIRQDAKGNIFTNIFHVLDFFVLTLIGIFWDIFLLIIY